MSKMSKISYIVVPLIIIFISTFFIQGCTPQCSNKYSSSIPYRNNNLLKGSGRMYALLIGIDQPCNCFQFKKKLDGPSDEIKKLHSFLKEEQNYAATLLVNEGATKESIMDSLKKLVTLARSEDRVLFYFTGHASQLDPDFWSSLDPNLRRQIPEDSDEFFLIPFQTEDDRINEIISLKEIAEILNKQKKKIAKTFSNQKDAMPIRQRIIIIDACYSGSFVNVSPLTNHIFNNELPPDGFYALTGLRAKVKDKQYSDIYLRGLKGEADTSVTGNHNNRVSIWELTQFVDYHLQKLSLKEGENYRSRYIFLGSGEVELTTIK